MHLSFLTTLACLLFINSHLALGFLSHTICSQSTSPSRMQLKASIYAEEPWKLSILPGDEAIFILSMISEDDTRRTTVESYLLDGLAREQMLLPPGSHWDRESSSFVRRSREHLKLIGEAVQNDAWEKYICAGCRPLDDKPQQLWACVDMTVQFAKVFAEFDKKYQREVQHAFQ